MPVFFLFLLIALLVPVIWPAVDLWVPGLFYRAGEGFFLADNAGLVALHWVAFYGARVLGVGFLILGVVAFVRRGFVAGMEAKGWAFLLVALIVAPGLVGNAGFKDHWGRARPREVVEFGGAAAFTPALVPQFDKARRNGSFVSGDAAFGFFLPAFGYVAPRRWARRVFWGGMAAGGVFGCARIAMGAHFFSDVVYAAAIMLTVVAAVHAGFYGRRATAAAWRGWFAPN